MPIAMTYHETARRFASAPRPTVAALRAGLPEQGQGVGQGVDAEAAIRIAVGAAVEAGLKARGVGHGGDGGDNSSSSSDEEGGAKRGKGKRPFPKLSALRDLNHLWEVYDKGVMGKKPLRELEEQGKKWREGHRKTWYEWQKFVAVVKARAAGRGISADQVVSQMEADRKARSKQVSAFVKVVGQEAAPQQGEPQQRQQPQRQQGSGTKRGRGQTEELRGQRRGTQQQQQQQVARRQQEQQPGSQQQQQQGPSADRVHRSQGGRRGAASTRGELHHRAEANPVLLCQAGGPNDYMMSDGSPAPWEATAYDVEAGECNRRSAVYR
jgi:hypothetical protein